ncbi:MAG TPA: serine hydrolase, partial [Allosphingosinicella sp.]
MTRFKLVAAAAALLAAQSAYGSGMTTGRADAVRKAVDGAFRPLIREHDIPGLAIAVSVDGEEHFFTYGVASREGNVPVSKETIFEIGSISKVFTATLASLAEASARLSWADHPSRFIPELKGTPFDRATLLNLGTYTAGGLPLQFPREVGDHGAMLAYFRKFEPTAEAGTQRTYSNPSLGLLGHVAARALGGDFSTLMEERLFANLGLGGTYIRVPEPAMSRYAWGYDRANEAVRVNPGLFAEEAYGVKTNAADMIR